VDCPLAVPVSVPVSAPRLLLVKADAAARTAPRVQPWPPVYPAGTTTFEASPAGLAAHCSAPGPRRRGGPAATGNPADEVPVDSRVTKSQAAFMPQMSPIPPRRQPHLRSP
jgi:hypothetical protein